MLTVAVSNDVQYTFFNLLYFYLSNVSLLYKLCCCMRFAVTRCANKSGLDCCGAEDTIPQTGNIDKRLPICYLDSSENNIKIIQTSVLIAYLCTL